MEIDEAPIAKAPSKETQATGLITYSQLGKKTNALVEHLRKNGYAAEAGHPAIGPALYPRLAMRAGLGYSGRHGMLITPEFGPRQRISAVFTSIKNLPVAGGNDHVWIREFCATCGNCIRKCPGRAIRDEPIEHPDGRLSHVDGDKCISCTVCMKECSFNKRGYTDIKKRFGRIE
jgi:epoxyqueuosine reductase QueG